MAVTTEPGRVTSPRRQDRPPAAAPLGILACGGSLPIEIARAAEAQGRSVFMVGIEGFVADEVADFHHVRAHLGQLGRILTAFTAAGTREIAIAGHMRRPNLLRQRVDWGFARHLPTVLSLTRGGDDSVLRRVVRFFEKQGFTVVGVGDVAPALLAPEGPLGTCEPTANDRQALVRAARLIADLGPFDVGQAVVATPDHIVAVEGVRGTDAMLRDLADPAIGSMVGKRGAVLLKLAKPGQEMRVDLPTVGTETVRRATAAHLAGIGVGTGSSIVLDQTEAAAAADAEEMFITGVSLGELGAAGGGHAPIPGEEGAAYVVPEILSRRTPTPVDRKDIAIARRLMLVLARHGGGAAAIVAREHVLAISGAMPVNPFVRAQERSSSWGRRAYKRRLGVLMIDARGLPSRSNEVVDEAATLAMLDRELFQAAKAVGVAGVGFCGRVTAEDQKRDLALWADEAGLFLLGFEG